MRSIAGVLALIILAQAGLAASPPVRIKDIAQVRDARDNQIMGFGLVVGLKQTGDSTQTEFTKQALTNLLSQMGISTPAPTSRSVTNPIYNLTNVPTNKEFKSKNVAAVMVTANLPAFVKPGQKIDVTVSSLGDATSLRGGTLLATPLQGLDGQVYAVAQGSVSLGGVSGSSFMPLNSEVTTSGRLPGGAIVEKEVPSSYQVKLTSAGTQDTASNASAFYIELNEPDFTTASRVAYSIAQAGYDTKADDAASIVVVIPSGQDMISAVSRIENLTVVPDIKAKIVINERTGTVVIGENIRIAPVAVTYGNYEVSIGNVNLNQSAYGSLSTSVRVREKNKDLTVVRDAASLRDLVRALNAIGANAKDMISILQAIRAAGALNAEIEVI